tara:strand:- start:7625 stop:9340 length:1716 start_codon:yes stop_codon:yes gene_type:complete
MGKKLILVLCSLVIQVGLIAQSNYSNFKTTISQLSKVPDTSPTFPFAYQQGVAYRLAYERSSLTGSHEFYQQYINDSKVLGSGLKVHYRHNGEIIVQTDNCITPNFKATNKTLEDSNLVWINSNSGLILTQLSEVQSPDLTENNEIYRDESGTVIFERSMNHLFHAPDSIAAFHVFFPDPITSSKSSYGGGFVDNNDQNNTSLQNEIYLKSIEAKFENDTFWLENDYIKMVQLGSTVKPAAHSKNGTFFYNRSELGFEDANVYYHITRLRAHMDSIGHSKLGKRQIWSDAHGLAGSDNSLYASNTNPPRILFGTGGVDDAEDVTVVVHEYGHALTDFAAPKSNIGLERGALDEGLCDYLATSYKTQISNYNWENVFPWDGHNEFNTGRLANSKRIYIEGEILDPHSRGEIISSALMEVYFDIGKNLTDQLIYESFYFLDNGMTLPQYGNILLTVEEELFEGLYKEDLCTALKNHDLITSCFVSLAESSARIIDFKIINSEGFANNNGALSFKSTSKIESVNVYNSLGKIVAGYTTNEGPIKIPSQSFTNGLYILEVKTSNAIYRHKVVKRF